MAIIWKGKGTRSNFNRFYYAKGGVVLKLYKTRRISVTKRAHVWALDLSYYTNGRSTIIGSKTITVHQTLPSLYYSNLKNRASKVAKRMVNGHVVRIGKFSTHLTEK